MWQFFRQIGLLLLVISETISCLRPTTLSPQALALENQCVQSLQAGDYDGAESRCELCLEYDENVPECINGLGLVAFARGELDKAISKFSKAIQVGPDFGQARNNLGALYFKIENYVEALPLLLAAIQLDPGYEDARYNVGLCYLRLAQKSELRKDFEDAKYNYNLAQNHYKKLVILNPEHSNGYRDLGLISTYLDALANENDPGNLLLESANGYYKKCLQVDATNDSCLQVYGESLLRQGKHEEAFHQFRKCLTINKENLLCVRGLAIATKHSMDTGR